MEEMVVYIYSICRVKYYKKVPEIYKLVSRPHKQALKSLFQASFVHKGVLTPANLRRTPNNTTSHTKRVPPYVPVSSLSSSNKDRASTGARLGSEGLSSVVGAGRSLVAPHRAPPKAFVGARPRRAQLRGAASVLGAWPHTTSQHVPPAQRREGCAAAVMVGRIGVLQGLSGRVPPPPAIGSTRMGKDGRRRHREACGAGVAACDGWHLYGAWQWKLE